jgi:hypothetical protein
MKASRFSPRRRIDARRRFRGHNPRLSVICEKAAMLELRPTCEHCNRALPAESTEARICSFECTFCADCVDGLLGNVCPNCGGGFTARPVRPARDWKGGNYLGRYPASTTVKHRPVDTAALAALAARLQALAPEQR